LSWQVPDPSQVSGSVQAVFDVLPHGVVAGSKQLSVFSWQVLHSVSAQGLPGELQLPAPSHCSTPVQYKVSSRQAVPDGSKQLSVASWQVLQSVSGQGLP
jgi:hypothetical protein